MGAFTSVFSKPGDVPLQTRFDENVEDQANVYPEYIPKPYVPMKSNTQAVDHFVANDSISRDYDRYLHAKTYDAPIDTLSHNNVVKLVQEILNTVHAVSQKPGAMLPDAVAAVCETIKATRPIPSPLVLQEVGYQIRKNYSEPSFYRAIQQMLKAFKSQNGQLGPSCGSDTFVQYERRYASATADTCNLVRTVYDDPLNRMCSGPVIGNYGIDNKDIDKTGRSRGSGGGDGGGGSKNAVPSRAVPVTTRKVALAIPR
jgi:hypothetical protein